MLIKSADDKSKRLALLEDLQKSPLLDRRQRDWLRDEQFRLKRGIAGERDAAHFLDNYLRDDPDRMLLHDLRFQVDGEVVQIDQLIITRSLYVYLLETKNFNGNLRINEHGEFSVEYSGERVFGIPSPLEQSRRHEGPLRKLFDRLEIRGRNGGAPQIEHCVLVSPSSLIHRPPAKAFDTSNVIKADGFRAWHEKFQQNTSFTPGRFVGALMNIRGADTIEEFARKLVRQHRPSDPLALPEFMKPRVETVAAVPPAVAPRREPVAPVQAPVPSAAAAVPSQEIAPERRKLICATCGVKISFAEGKFCWNNEKRFGGVQYCRQHQSAWR
ncbi:MAG: nuclease-related domain-containing protein [Rubrivivax sp.]